MTRLIGVIVLLLFAINAQAQDQTEVLAWIGDRPITRQELEDRLDELAPNARAQFRTPEGRRQLLERMIEEMVWLQAAVDAGIESREEVQKRLEQTRRNLLVRTYLQDLMTGVPTPSDSAIAAYYEEHVDEDRYQTQEAAEVRHIMVATEEEAEEVLERLDKGETFDELARELSMDGASKDNGGNMGRIERQGIYGALGRQIALAESTFLAPVGVPSGPFPSTTAWHVIQVDELVPPTAIPLQNVRPQIVAQLSRDLQESFYEDKLDEAENDVGLRWNEAAVDSFLYGRKTAGELFREAQDAPTADGRLAGYQTVVDHYPNSEFAPQALFMIGFIYSEEKNDYDKAETEFNTLIAKYPDSPLTSSAQWMLENMGSQEVPDFDFDGGIGTDDPDRSNSPDE